MIGLGIATSLWLAAVGYAAPAKPARKPAAAAAKPQLSADQVMERFVEATGGKAAYEKLTTMVMTGTIRVAAQGLSGSFEVQAKDPDKILVVQNIGGIGESREGFDGKSGWSKDPINGLRDLTGPELSSMKRASSLNTPSDWKKLYKRVEMLGIRKVGTRPAYAIKMVPPDGKPSVSYYDAESFYLVKMEMTVESPQGTIPTESFLSDYRDVAGVKLPFVTRQRVAGLTEIVMTTTEVKPNVPIEDSVFARPAQ